MSNSRAQNCRQLTPSFPMLAKYYQEQPRVPLHGPTDKLNQIQENLFVKVKGINLFMKCDPSSWIDSNGEDEKLVPRLQ